jgi:phasin family protein
MKTERWGNPKEIEMAEPKSSTRQADKTTAELSGAARGFAEQGGDFAWNAAIKTKAAAQEATRTAGEVCSTFTGNALDFHRRWIEIEMVRENTSATLDFVHQVLDVKSPSEFVELAAEYARKQAETFTEQARQLTGMTQKMSAGLAAPMQAAMKYTPNKAA